MVQTAPIFPDLVLPTVSSIQVTGHLRRKWPSLLNTEPERYPHLPMACLLAAKVLCRETDQYTLPYIPLRYSPGGFGNHNVVYIHEGSHRIRQIYD